MKLKDLEIFVVAPPYPGWGGRYWIFPKLTTDTGIVGYGEVCPLGPFYLPAYAAGVRAVAFLTAHKVADE
mgnify:CR=1 FL=1